MTMWELIDAIEIQGCVNIKVWDEEAGSYILNKSMEKMTEKERLTYFGDEYVVAHIYSERESVVTFEIEKKGSCL